MSERGSFVTEYIYCDSCLAVAKEVLLGKEKYLCSQQVAGWEEDGSLMPIIAGKIGGLHAGEEVETFDVEFREKLEERICCVMNIAVLSEDRRSSKILRMTPAGTKA